MRGAEVEPLGRVANQTDELEPRRLLHFLAERTAQRVGDVDLAALQHRQARQILGHGLPHQALHRGGLAPVTIVRLQRELDPRVERRELVRPRSDWRLLEALVADLLDVLLGNDPARAAGRRAVERHEVGPRLFQTKADAVRVGHLDGRDLLLQQTGGRALVSLERELDVLGRQRVAVVEHDALAHDELVHEPILRRRPGLGERRRERLAGHRLHHRVVHGGEHHHHRDDPRVLGRIEPDRRERDVDRPRHLPRGRLGAGLRLPRRGRVRNEKSEQEDQDRERTPSVHGCLSPRSPRGIRFRVGQAYHARWAR